ncbi:MAG: YfhO family protein [Candidatus Omnitrophica bacterium]|nr:YfhO family protein [Candidatus Omnitrophota bacterium]
MSLYPIFMYFILRFFLTLQWQFLIATLLFFLICLSNGIIHASYLYIGMHFFALSGLIWSALHNRDGWNSALNRLKSASRKYVISAIVGISLAALVLVGPYAYIIRFALGDVAFGSEDSRIHQMFNPNFYFHKLELHLGDPRFFFKDTLDFLSTDYHFLGWTIWFLALCGLVMNRNRFRWIFLWSIVFLWLLNHPREHINIGTVAHWINFLTNPLKSLCRAYYIGTYTMLPYLLMPLAALGIESLIALKNCDARTRRSWLMIGFLTILIAAITRPYLPAAPQLYLTTYTGFLIVVILWAAFRYSQATKTVFICLLTLGTLTDIGLTVDKIKKHNALHYQIKPVDLQATLHSGPVITEFENPKITPLREFQSTDFFFKDETYLWFPQGLGNNFSNMTNPILNFLYLNGHTPRHAEFKEWQNDGEMLNYVRQNKSTFWVASAAVNAQPGMLQQITAAGLAQDVVMIDDPLRVHQLSDGWPDGFKPSVQPVLKTKTFSGTIQQMQWDPKKELASFSARLPSDFPFHLTSSWFADHQHFLRLSLQSPGEKPVFFDETQGRLIRPYTFDVQNIREGWLTAAIPADSQFHNETFVLDYPSVDREGITHVGIMTNDKISLNYRTAHDGWFVAHYPYDLKWKITLDGHVIQYFRANKSFIAFPLDQGDHTVLLEYWPHSYLRPWLTLSAAVATLGLPLLILFGIRWEKNNNPF